MMPGDWESQQRQIDYERKLAEKLAGDTEMPQGGMVGGVYVPPAWTQMLAKALNPMWAKQHRESADKKSTALGAEMQAERAGTMDRYSKALQGTPESMTGQMYPAGGNPDEEGGMGYQPAVAGSRDAALAELAKSRDPAFQQMAMAAQLKGLEPKKPIVVGRTLMDETGKQIGVDSTWQGEQQAARTAQDQRAAESLQVRRDLAAQQEAMRRDLAAQASGDRRMIAGMMDARREQKNVPKLPTSALKMQQEELDAVGTASSINADLAAMGQQIDSGKLQLGPVNNLLAKGKNLIGASDESSRNLATFQSTLEKLRNDSLRLNKGVQTEGDAQRAWNEMITNINDPKVVKQRLGEIQKINERAANLRKMNVENIRQNFGVEPLDTGGYQNQPAAVGGGGGSNVDALLKKYGG
jgi:hypothetical protein